ncbi:MULTISPECIES: acetate/propionate family kinase [Nitrosomonas]|uniref:Acetate kinase n=1 Tax=Nitrosomonas communis TaxID=44574 RepID=A0A0F7KGQ3_9PROT|nr:MULTISPECIES: acetate/propionate family kinase [Nitrosomonas]AKH37979.1 acetate kinase [Nitrosomonas communis]TYP91581.1 acetate kinase [Nitrosomonas communis]UVS59858.1 acetate/propionate family kinase [Nitrosomonas sp. PLL12]
MSNSIILVVNAGSSSLKFSVFRVNGAENLPLVIRGQMDGIGTRPYLKVRDANETMLVESDLTTSEAATVGDAITLVGAWLRERLQHESLFAVGHRVVHGGTQFSHPVLVDREVLMALEQLIPLAPLHQPHNLAAIRAIGERQPQIPQVACFDTAFHRTHPQIADLYALPWKYYESGVRHYGFHGLSYEYIALILPKMAPEIANGRVIVAHLGSGASLCALRAGKSIDSTMGFSPLDGVPMGTRPGALDPGVLLYLVNQCGLSGGELETLLYKESGLLGLSGISNDMRILLESQESRAQLAVEYFVHYTVKQIGALAAVLGGVDGIVFTAGIGEHSPVIRARILQACAWLGVSVDTAANERSDSCISSTDSKVSAWVIPTNEELMIARHTLALINSRKGGHVE